MLEKLIIFIPIENIGFERFVQTFSLYTFIVAIISPFLLLFLKIKKTSIFSSILLLTIWLIFSSAVKTLIEFEVPENFFRAFSGLVIGLLLFISLREIFHRYDSLNWFKYLYYSYIILFVFFIYDLIFNFQETFRIYASYTEPSHLGNDLALIYIPMFILYSEHMRRIQKLFIFLSLIVITILSFSATTYVKILFFFSLYLILSINKPRQVFYLLFIAMISIISIFIFFRLYPNNYFVIMSNSVIDNIKKGYDYLPISLTDRASFWIFLFNLFNNNTEFSIGLLLKFIFGGGLGNDLSFLQFLPPVVADQIMSVKAFGSYITSFFGRIFSYGGIIGFILYFIFIFSIYKKIKLISSTSKQKAVLVSWLITYLFACSFDIAPFQTIALWFLPAYIDGISLKLKKLSINNYTYK